MRKLTVILLVVLAATLMVGLVGAQDEEPAGDSERAYLGIVIVAPEDGDGVLVRRVGPNSPAAEAGLQRGDLITAVDGEAVSAETLPDVIASYTPGDTITLTVERDGETLELTATLVAVSEVGFGRGGPGSRMQLADNLIIFDPFDQTWVVRAVAEDGVLYEAGLRAGDRVLSLDGETYDPITIREHIDGLDEGATVSLSVLRDSQIITLDVPAAGLDVALIGPGNFGDFGGRRDRDGRGGRPGGGSFGPGNGFGEGQSEQPLTDGTAAGV